MSNDDFFGDSKPLSNAMADLETMSTRPNAAILSIGAVTFDMRKLTLGERFYTTISPKSCEEAGLHIDAGTIEWWNKQSEVARRAAFAGQHTLRDGLVQFAEWIEANMVEQKSRCIWGNGANFDVTILESAFRAAGLLIPWEFWSARCFRTFKALWPNVEAPKREGVHHNALDDAIHQVEWMFKIRRSLRGNS